ncbi:3'-5' exoribonuclease domain-containing protein [Uliginosibacterium gangwonense]|uniref:3'-5' exoribonuclease domain-containing protein n=1 Tax=Uliginosibacterium gangwonense TaxID=392736 RepID=UPI0003658033|nr:3'-5' exoribonuclease [Uliginosibacterium gangwonense]
MNNNVVISAKTLGTGTDAVIYSISAISFNGERFQRFIDIDSCLNLGLTVDGRSISTLVDEGGHDGMTVSLQQALMDLREFTAWEEVTVWLDMAQHTAAQLDTAYRRAGLSLPWRFWNLRDINTAVGETLTIHGNSEVVAEESVRALMPVLGTQHALRQA